MKRRVWLKGSGPPPLARQLVIAAIQSLAAGRPGLPGPSKSSPGTWPPASSGYALPWAGWCTKAGW